MGFIIFLVFASIIALLIKKSVQGSKKYNSLISVLTNQPNFNNDYYYLTADGQSIIGLDRNRRIICIVHNDLIPHILTRNEILKVDILVDKRTFHTGSFLSSWGRFIVVQSLTGNANLAELEGRRNLEVLDKMITIQLMVATKNLSYSNHYLPFLINGNAKQKGTVLKDVYDWATKIESL